MKSCIANKQAGTIQATKVFRGKNTQAALSIQPGAYQLTLDGKWGPFSITQQIASAPRLETHCTLASDSLAATAVVEVDTPLKPLTLSEQIQGVQPKISEIQITERVQGLAKFPNATLTAVARRKGQIIGGSAIQRVGPLYVGAEGVYIGSKDLLLSSVGIAVDLDKFFIASQVSSKGTGVLGAVTKLGDWRVAGQIQGQWSEYGLETLTEIGVSKGFGRGQVTASVNSRRLRFQ